MSHGHPLPLLDPLRSFMKTAQKQAGINVSGRTLVVVFTASIILFCLMDAGQSVRNFNLLIFLTPLWLPALLLGQSSAKMVELRHLIYHNEPKQRGVLIEMRMPRDTMKSPLAMETVFKNLAFAPGESTWWKRAVLGRTRPWYSFEIVSTEGSVHFYIWTWASQRRAVESYIYAQYPGVELIEAIDYSRLVDPSHDPYRLWVADFVYSADDPWPIKTYEGFGLDKNPKPEEQVDPLAQVTEFLAALNKGEHIWIQLIARAHHKRSYQFWGRKNKKGEPFTIIDYGMEIVEELRKATERTTEFTDPVTGQTSKRTAFANPTKGQAESIAMVENKIYKQMYDVGARCMYFGKGDAYVGPTGSHLGNIFKPFNGANRIEPVGGVEDFYDYPWEDIGGKRLEHVKHQSVEVYRRRAFFYPPYVGWPMTMGVDELATLFHVPSSAAGAIPRIPSTTSGAPSNLPT